MAILVVGRAAADRLLHSADWSGGDADDGLAAARRAGGVLALMVLYLAVMVMQGALPTQRQLVEFQPKGVLKTRTRADRAG